MSGDDGDEFVLVELDGFQSFFQSFAMENKPVLIRGLDGSDQQISLSVEGLQFEGSMEPIVGTALLFGDDSTTPVCSVTRQVIFKTKDQNELKPEKQKRMRRRSGEGKEDD